jgi:hypothetical protein
MLFLGKVGVDWILTVMPRIKNRSDCLHIAQQLVDKQFILPLKRQKAKSSSAPAPPKFLDDDSVLYYFTVYSWHTIYIPNIATKYYCSQKLKASQELTRQIPTFWEHHKLRLVCLSVHLFLALLFPLKLTDIPLKDPLGVI